MSRDIEWQPGRARVCDSASQTQTCRHKLVWTITTSSDLRVCGNRPQDLLSCGDLSENKTLKSLVQQDSVIRLFYARNGKDFILLLTGQKLSKGK